MNCTMPDRFSPELLKLRCHGASRRLLRCGLLGVSRIDGYGFLRDVRSRVSAESVHH